MLKRIPIRLKLILLAGVPVIGALILAISIAREAQRQAESAAALGSIEDLARLSAQMSSLVHELQFERHELSLRSAEKTLSAPQVGEQIAKTDAARQQLADFLATRQVSSLPRRLARDLDQAQKKLAAIEAERKLALSGERPIESGQLPQAIQVVELQNAWRHFADRVLSLAGNEEEPLVEVAYDELQELEQAAAERVPYPALAELLRRLRLERGIVRLRRVAEQAKSLAERLGKSGLEVKLEVGKDVRFQAERWAPFWSAFIHVIRNALDHGIETAEQRVTAGKTPHGTLRLSAAIDGEFLTIQLIDDGRGVDWVRVRAKAKERGLPHATDQDLASALFSDGLSTAETVSDVSGRGVGMSAVRDATLLLGGSVNVLSKPKSGTTVRFRFPLMEALRESSRSLYPGARPSLVPPPTPAPRSAKVSIA